MALIQVRIDDKLKNNVDNTLSILGINTNEAIRIFLNQINLTGSIPFEIKIPNYNKKTKLAIEETLKVAEDTKSYKTVNELFKDLDSNEI